MLNPAFRLKYGLPGLFPLADGGALASFVVYERPRCGRLRKAIRQCLDKRWSREHPGRKQRDWLTPGLAAMEAVDGARLQMLACLPDLRVARSRKLSLRKLFQPRECTGN